MNSKENKENIENTENTDRIEDLALRYSGRGMDALRPFLPEAFYRKAADRLLDLRGGTVIVTAGFYVAGVCETDGPPGAICLAETLRNLGFRPVILTDESFRRLFDGTGIPVLGASPAADDRVWEQLLEEWKPAALISVERCGRNRYGEYANMHGGSITAHTAPVDRLFELAAAGGIYTAGIGDGGNEIGMGNLQEQIREQLSLEPCTVRTEDLLIATVSNWGAYALSAALNPREKRREIMPSYERIATCLQFLAEQGCVDGLTGKVRNWADGFPPETEKEIYTALLEA